MRKGNKNIFIEGFKDPNPISSLQDILLLDIKGDGDHKLILFDRDTASLIIYKGISKDYEKAVEIKNVSHMIAFYDEDSRTPQPCIALGAENAIYIFRNLKESFRLKIPDLIPDPEEQVAWYEHCNDTEALTKELERIQGSKRLTENAKYFVGASTKQRKQELLKSAFEDGIIAKDAISCLGVIRQKDIISIQNLVICTELKQCHILDNFGHVILLTINLGFVGFQIFGEGQLLSNYYLVVVGREETVAVIENGNIREKFRLPSRAKSSSLDYPILYVLTMNRTIISYDISGKHLKKSSFSLPVEALQIQAIRTRSFKALVVGCEYQIRVYNDTLLICKLDLDSPLKCFRFGTSSRQQNCLIIVYAQNGFQVKIMHRQFSHNYKYQKLEFQKEQKSFPIPKITSIFATEMMVSDRDPIIYKQFQKDMKILKWRTLTEQLKMEGVSNNKLSVNANVVGIGPYFVLKIEVENMGEEVLQNVVICLNFDSSVYEVKEYQSLFPMLVPNFSYPLSINIKNVSESGEASTIYFTVEGPKLQQFSSSVAIPQSQLLF